MKKEHKIEIIVMGCGIIVFMVSFILLNISLGVKYNPDFIEEENELVFDDVNELVFDDNLLMGSLYINTSYPFLIVGCDYLLNLTWNNLNLSLTKGNKSFEIDMRKICEGLK